MTPSHCLPAPSFRLTAWACALGLLFGGLAQAQTIYRIVGPDGRISFSDKPPAQGNQATTVDASGRSAPSGSTGDMPYEVREAMGRYPVTLYTGDGCDPCAAARSLLTRRGVPFSERTLRTAEDLDALKKLGMEPTIPLATIGSQRLKGYSEEEWNTYLDAAGYPRSSRLPASYRNPAASPLAPVAQKAPTTAGDNAPAAAPADLTPPATSLAPQPPAPPAANGPDNPAGIVF